nr:hypothetical protein [Tanacetum cinerariifolium]
LIFVSRPMIMYLEYSRFLEASLVLPVLNRDERGSRINNGVPLTVIACASLDDVVIPRQSDATHIVDRPTFTHPNDIYIDKALYLRVIDKNSTKPPSLNCDVGENVASYSFSPTNIWDMQWKNCCCQECENKNLAITFTDQNGMEAGTFDSDRKKFTHQSVNGCPVPKDVADQGCFIQESLKVQ